MQSFALSSAMGRVYPSLIPTSSGFRAVVKHEAQSRILHSFRSIPRRLVQKSSRRGARVLRLHCSQTFNSVSPGLPERAARGSPSMETALATKRRHTTAHRGSVFRGKSTTTRTATMTVVAMRYKPSGRPAPAALPPATTDTANNGLALKLDRTTQLKTRSTPA